MLNILDNNERAYFKRYGIHLSEKLNNLSDIEYEKAFDLYMKNAADTAKHMLSFDRNTILRIAVGCADGYCMSGMISNSLSSLRVLIWEPDEAYFLICCCNADMSKLIDDDRLTFVVGRDRADIELAIRMNLFDINYCYSKIIALGQYAERNNPDVVFFSGILEAVSEEVAMGGRLGRVLDTQPCENVLQAISLINNNSVISQFFETVPEKDIPVIIVSAGPSLMNNCKDLKQAENRAIVVAVSHAMKTLFREKITPDFVAVADGEETGYLNFENEKKYTLLGSIFSDKELQKSYNGRIVFYGFRLQEHIFTSKRTSVEPNIRLNTGSVATDVFSLFVSAGFKKIILVGQDLAYAANGCSHTENETESGIYDKNETDIYTDGVNGGKVRTRHDWEDFRRIFEEMIKEHKDIRIIDATEGGALIHGTVNMTLREAIEDCCDKEYPISEWIAGLKKGDDEEKAYISQWFDAAVMDIRMICNYLEEIIALNELIRDRWDDRDSWDDEFSAKCRRYDVLYGQIVEGMRGELLRFYCTKEIHTYRENSMIYVEDENVIKRLLLEYELFLGMRKKSEELTVYINKLISK